MLHHLMNAGVVRAHIFRSGAINLISTVKLTAAVREVSPHEHLDQTPESRALVDLLAQLPEPVHAARTLLIDPRNLPDPAEIKIPGILVGGLPIVTELPNYRRFAVESGTEPGKTLGEHGLA